MSLELQWICIVFSQGICRLYFEAQVKVLFDSALVEYTLD